MNHFSTIQIVGVMQTEILKPVLLCTLLPEVLAYLKAANEEIENE